jgi:acetyl-CoA/propionyl-CoA carboxylase biotin carboxyl carrier protein
VTAVFDTVLVANRGEIAVRVIRTLRRLGIRSVAVYSDADAAAEHVRLADVAVRIGPPPAAQSYLSIEAILAAAARTGAQAIHPGYGFLSENVDFAIACAEAGVVFIGPGVDAIRAMADKITAKERVIARGVPVVPGSSGSGLDDAALIAAAHDIGFPLLIKPSAGGGGKGMQTVRTEEELPAALASARRIAAASFGDDTLLLERLIEQPRHIEVQVFADRHGSVIHLGERECSLQRRHQKVIEEAPSPLLDAETRERIGAAACEVARSVDYEGAGTVEFLISAADPGTFHFIEMNTRLQVEHPVTELVTGLDLVELQLRVAAGEPLGIAQADVAMTGHAIEARIYAESPERGFLPATGTVIALHEPTGPGMRIDSGLVAGLVVSGNYDPMLAKAIGYGVDRAAAITTLDTMLSETVVLGLETNLAFLRSLLADPDVRAGRLDTGLIDRLGVPAAPTAEPADVAAAALVLHDRARARRASGPWASADGWRAGGRRRPSSYVIQTVAGPSEVLLTGSAADALVSIDGAQPVAASVRAIGADSFRFAFDGQGDELFAVVEPGDSGDQTVWLRHRGNTFAFAVPSRSSRVAAMLETIERSHGPANPEVRATMPGTVVVVAVADGDVVEAGDVIVTIEAMKMEQPLVAPLAGVVRVNLRPGDLVRRDQIVATIEPTASEAA